MRGELRTSWRWKLLTKWRFPPWRSPVPLWAPLSAPRMRRELRVALSDSYYSEFLRNRSDVMSKLLRARVGRFADLVLRGRGNPVLLDPEICLDLSLARRHARSLRGPRHQNHRRCDELSCSQRDRVRHGPLRPAVAGSMAIPGLFRPVIFGDEVLIDGGAVNPLPYDLLSALRILSSPST